MKIEHFLSQLEHDRIVDAIVEAEKRTSGEIRVYISHRKMKDALGPARERFSKLGLHKTAWRNAVLIFIAPRSQVFAVVGDTAVHQKCGDLFWNEAIAHLAAGLKKETITDALTHAIREISNLLAVHFPPETGGRKESPNDLLKD